MTIVVKDTDTNFFSFVTGNNTQVDFACSNHFDDPERFKFASEGLRELVVFLLIQAC